MKKNIKKIAALLTAIVLTAGMLSACGDADSSGSNSADNGAYTAGKSEKQENINGGNKYSNKETEAAADAEQGDEQSNGAEVNEAEVIDGFFSDDIDLALTPSISSSITADGTYGLQTDGFYNSEEYKAYVENTFVSTAEEPLSTFSTDVDTASYTNIRRMINDGWEIDPDAVRTEEFINYFKYDYPQPENNDKLSITTELSDCPWNSGAKLMLVGLQAQQTEVKDIDSNIVFLIDVSGSMSDEDKLPLVQQAFGMLAENLDQEDRISIVTYAGTDSVVLEGENGGNTKKITDALNSLVASGSTAGAAGINTAYDIASKYFIEGGNNRVILATDGDLNVGLSSEEELTELITEKKESGIFLSVLGFGTGNYKDNRLEALADNGNGNYAYIDTLDEAERVLITEMNGTLFTVAKDTKVQVEFDPNAVTYYKLVGYENRLLDAEDFEDDTKDAGDVGAGQQVTALYEIITADSAQSGELLTVSVRYKEADEDESKLIDKAVSMDSYIEADKISSNMCLASGLAMFAKAIRSSYDQSETAFTAKDIMDYYAAHSLPEKYDEINELLKKYAESYE